MTVARNILTIVFFGFLSVAVVSGHFGKCRTPRRQHGLCQYLRECDSLFSLMIKEPLTIQDRRFLRQSQCGYHKRQPLVCCTDTIDGGLAIRPNLLPSPGTCGTEQLAHRVYGGNETQIDEFPWMTLLQYTKSNNRKGFHCGGVLISDRYVLTAAHCIAGNEIPKSWTLSSVRLGEWDLSTDLDCVDGECAPAAIDVDVVEIFPHERYAPLSKNQINDIAVLRLGQSVEFSDFVRPICLPYEFRLRAMSYDGVVMSVAGWGKTEKSGHSDVKLKVQMTGVNNVECSKVYAKQGTRLIHSQLCAGGQKGKDSCRGDSGGSIMAVATSESNQQPYWYLAGIVSFGPSPCGQEGWPGVYTRVGSYIEWIESKLRQ